MRWGRRGLWLVGFLVGGVATLTAQTPIRERAEEAARAWRAHEMVRVVGRGGEGLQVHLPGAEPAVALGAGQAVAMLQNFVRRHEEERVEVVGAREVGTGIGYVELRRRFRVSGTDDVRTQRVLLSYRRVGAGWILVEVRVLG